MTHIARTLSALAIVAVSTGPALGSVPPRIKLAAGTVGGTTGTASGTGAAPRIAGAAPAAVIACGINADLAVSPDGQILTTKGPAASIYQQSATGVAVSFPSLSVTATQPSGLAAYRYYASGAAVLRFTDATSGAIQFLPGGTTFSAAPRYSPTFSDFTQSYDPATDIVTVAFTVTIGECSVPFNATYQA